MPACNCAAFQREWTAHKDPSGFTLNIPPGSTVKPEATGGIEIAVPGGERLLIWPVFIASGLDPRGATAVLRKMAGMLAPGISWGMPQAVGAGAVRQPGRQPGQTALAAITWA
ncbi:MAG: hypothetical protein ACPL88_06670, partial [Bryobacteraceae bacterium]